MPNADTQYLRMRKPLWERMGWMRREFFVIIGTMVVGCLLLLGLFTPSGAGSYLAGGFIPSVGGLPFPTHTPTAPATTQAQTEAAIYAIMIDGAPTPFGEGTLAKVLNWSWVWNMDGYVPFNRVTQVAPTISATAWDEFRRTNQESLPLPIPIPVRRFVNWETPHEIASHFRDRERLGWEHYIGTTRYDRDDPRATLEVVGYMALSQIYFDANGTDAFAVLRMECGEGCSEGVLFTFHRINNSWELASQGSLWKSADLYAPSAAPTPTALIPDVPPLPTAIVLDATTDAARWDNERSVIRAALQAHCGVATPIEKIQTESYAYITERYITDSWGSSNPDETIEWLEDEWGTVNVTLWNDFVAQNWQSYPLPDDIPRNGKVASRAGTFIREYLIDLPRLCGRLTLSRAGFNNDGTQAIIYVDEQCRGLCGIGMLYLLEKQNGVWVMIGEKRVWIS